jgi:predicted O-linked N-acetylglucosamine transferase (SPINDLY family)
MSSSHDFINGLLNCSLVDFIRNRKSNVDKLINKAGEFLVESPPKTIEAYECLFVGLQLETNKKSIEEKMLQLVNKDPRLLYDIQKLFPSNFSLSLLCGKSEVNNNNLDSARHYFINCLHCDNVNNNELSEAYFCLGHIHFTANQVKNAFIYFDKSYELNKSRPALNMLGVICMLSGEPKKALNYFEKIDTSKMNNFELSDHYINVAFCHTFFNNNEKAFDFMNLALKYNPKNQHAFLNKILHLLYNEKISPEELFEETKKINDFFEIQSHSKEEFNYAHITPKIAVLTGDLNKHPVSYFIKNLLENNEISIFSNGPVLIDAKYKGKAFNISSLKDEEANELIRNKEIDILLDLSGFTNKNRLSLLALKPAPIIINYLGYPSSCGLSTIDYRITDFWIDVDNQKYNSEKLLLFKNNSFLNYNTEHIKNTIDKKTNEDEVIFGVYNRIQKINGTLLTLWSRVLDEIPNSKIVFKHKDYSNKDIQDFILNYLPKDRVEFRKYHTDMREHFDSFNDIDIQLDTFPYSGTTTTCDSLSMGVPVITFVDKSKHHQSVSGSILHHSDLSEYIAYDKDEYVEICKSASKKKFNALEIREKFISGKVCNYESFEKEFFELMNSVFE